VLPILALGMLAAAGAAGAGGGNAFWVCLPAALLAASFARTNSGAALGAASVAALAAAPQLALGVGALPAPGLALAVGTASVLVLVAVRERLVRERDQLRDVALSDPLTGIANRRLLLARADYEVARHMRAQHKFAVVMIDLDGFKLLNDRFGHAAGDELLCDVATGLMAAVRAQDTVARIGGDEFCVLAPETDGSGIPQLTRRVTAAVADAAIGLQMLRASVGVAVFPDDGVKPDELLRIADERMLSTKRQRQRGQGIPRRRAA
jgi:diguanylate cyclase (GGDEF)-like protein